MWECYARTEYVTGHDGMWHATKRDGTCLCSMGRARPPTYDDSDEAYAQCLECLVRLWRRTA
jgi:hypothetical protein